MTQVAIDHKDLARMKDFVARRGAVQDQLMMFQKACEDRMAALTTEEARFWEEMSRKYGLGLEERDAVGRSLKDWALGPDQTSLILVQQRYRFDPPKAPGVSGSVNLP